MARLYADENFPLQVVERLRWHGHEVLTVQDDGCAGQAITVRANTAALSVCLASGPLGYLAPL